MFGQQSQAHIPVIGQNVGELGGYQFQFGQMRRTTRPGPEGQPPITEYEKVGELNNIMIAANTKAIIGTYSFEGPEGKRVTEPIELSAEGRPLWVTGKPQLFVPPEYSPATGRGYPGVGAARAEGKTVRTVSSAPIVSQLTAQYGEQMDVLPYSMGQPFESSQAPTSKTPMFLQVPTAFQVAGAAKGFGLKASVTPAFQPEGGSFYPNVQVAGQNVLASALTGEMKSPTAAFAGEFFALPRERQTTMLGEFNRVNPALGKAMQEYSRGVPMMEIEEMERVYAGAMGQEVQPGQQRLEMFESLRNVVETQVSPQRSMALYGRTPIWSTPKRGKRSLALGYSNLPLLLNLPSRCADSSGKE
jgi:hypothetical protein